MSALLPVSIEPTVEIEGVLLRHPPVRAAENSHQQGPEVCPSRQACDFEAQA